MASTLSDDQHITGSLKIGNATNPPEHTAGSGAMDTTNKSNGSTHFRTDLNSLPEVMHNGAKEKYGLGQHDRECRMDDLTANQATTYKTYTPRGLKVTRVTRRYTTKPASAGGSVVVGITGAGNALLASASEDEEGLSDDTLTEHNLTGTAADLLLSKGDVIIITITSNNGDMTGGIAPMYFLEYEDN